MRLPRPSLVPAILLLLSSLATAQEYVLPDDLAYAAHAATNTVGAGTSGWTILESEPRVASEEWILAARPVLFSRHAEGSVRFDELTISEYDASGAFLRDVMAIDLGTTNGWTRTGPGQLSAGSEGGRDYLEISGAGETWLCEKSLRFPVQTGHAYSIRGIARGLGVASGSWVSAGFALVFEFSPSGQSVQYPAPAPEEPAEPEPIDEQPAPGAEPPAAEILPVLLVISNNDFYYREYAEPRQELEAAGIQVVVAAGRLEASTPHPGTGQGADGGIVMPDLALADVDASDYSAIAFVGGWGPSAYQYAFPGQYSDPAYNGDPAIKAVVNQLIADFDEQGKILGGICYGVTVLAWCRIDGLSPLQGRTVVGGPLGSPAVTVDGTFYDYFQLPTDWHVEANGGDMLPANSVGDPNTPVDDVLQDGRILTTQDYDSAAAFGRTLAEILLAE